MSEGGKNTYVAEVGRLMGLSSDPSAPAPEALPADLPPHPNKAGIVQRASERAGRNANFEMRYTEQEFDRLTAVGQRLGLNDKEVEDLIYIGSRNDITYNNPVPNGPLKTIQKRLTASALEAQMQDWTEVVKPRGYPHRFKDKAEFQRFSDTLIDKAREAGLPSTDIRVQGSSLRKREAGDVDIVIFIGQDEFARIVVDYFKDKPMRKIVPAPKGKKAVTSERITDLGTYNYAQVVNLADDMSGNPRRYNAVGKQFAHAVKGGIMNAKHEFSPTKALTATMAGLFPDANIESVSIEIGGGGFDLSPSLTLAHS